MPQEASFTVLFTSHLNIPMPSAQFSSNDCTIPIPCDTSQRCRILPSGMFDAFSTTTWTCQTQCTHCWWFTSVSNPMILLRLRNAGSHPKSKKCLIPTQSPFQNLSKSSETFSGSFTNVQDPSKCFKYSSSATFGNSCHLTPKKMINPGDCKLFPMQSHLH